MPGTLYKLRPDRDLQCYFERPSAIAALSSTSESGFTVSGCWRQQFDWAVVEWNRDNVFEHPALRNLPDGDLSGLSLSYEETRTNCIPVDSRLYPTVDWPYLRVWAESGGTETLYKIPIQDHAAPLGEYVAPKVQFELLGLPTSGDYIELAWLDQHFNYRLNGNDTLESAIHWLAEAITANQATGGVSATSSGPVIELTYHGAAGTNGNRLGAYGTVHGAGTELWASAARMFSGGVTPQRWQVTLDFSALVDSTGAAVPMTNVRKMRWTWSANLQERAYERSEFSVVIANWTVTGANRNYRVAGTGSRRVEDDSETVFYEGTWTEARGNYSGGSIRWTNRPGASTSCTYRANGTHALYVGTRLADQGAQIMVCVDNGTPSALNLKKAGEDVLVRLLVPQTLGAGEHLVTITHGGEPGAVFYFDFLEIAYPTTDLPVFDPIERLTLATDWDTDHSIAIAPERTAWLIHTLGFVGRANHYVGAMWFYELQRAGHSYASGSVTFAGDPEFGKRTKVFLGPTAIEHMNLIGDSAETVATALAMLINAGSTGVWAQTVGSTLTITSRVMGLAGNALTLAAETASTTLTFATSGGTLQGGLDGVWRTDTATSPKVNRAVRDWTRAFFVALKNYSIAMTAAFSMELQHGDDTTQAKLAQRYPNGDPTWLNTPALQTNFGPESTAFWREVHREMADVMVSAGVPPYLQFGEVQWWYFAAASGMPFYDSYTKTTFQNRFGRPMGVIASEHSDPGLFPDECGFLPGLIGDFTNAVMAHVRLTHADARFEVLYPPDVNDTPLNRLVNLPLTQWTPERLECLKTENFTFTGNRNMNQASASIQLPMLLGFPREQSSHLVGIGDYTTPWNKEVRIAMGEQLESVVLFALDQFCLIGYQLPLERSTRRSQFQGGN